MQQTKAARWVATLFIVTLVVMVCLSLVLTADDDMPPWVAPARAARKKNPIAADAKSIAAGKDLYVANCLKCHGDKGKGDGPSAAMLTPRPKDLSDPQVSSQSDGALFWKINTGRPPMPQFATLLSDTDVWNVINYVRTIAPPPATQPVGN